MGENPYDLIVEYAMPNVYLKGKDYETIVPASLIRYPLHGPKRINALTWISPSWAKGETI